MTEAMYRDLVKLLNEFGGIAVWVNGVLSFQWEDDA